MEDEQWNRVLDEGWDLGRVKQVWLLGACHNKSTEAHIHPGISLSVAGNSQAGGLACAGTDVTWGALERRQILHDGDSVQAEQSSAHDGRRAGVAGLIQHLQVPCLELHFSSPESMKGLRLLCTTLREVLLCPLRPSSRRRGCSIAVSLMLPALVGSQVADARASRHRSENDVTGQVWL